VLVVFQTLGTIYVNNIIVKLIFLMFNQAEVHWKVQLVEMKARSRSYKFKIFPYGKNSVITKYVRDRKRYRLRQKRKKTQAMSEETYDIIQTKSLDWAWSTWEKIISEFCTDIYLGKIRRELWMAQRLPTC